MVGLVDRYPVLVESFQEIMSTAERFRIGTILPVSEAEVRLSHEAITHENDRPIFCYAARPMGERDDVYFISGDASFFTENLPRKIHHRFLRPTDFLDLMMDEFELSGRRPSGM